MAIPPSPLSSLKTAWFGPDGREVDATPAVIGPRGPPGEQGVQGETGASAYEVAVANGFEGTEPEWLASLAAESAAAEQAAVNAQLAAQAAQDAAQAAESAAATAATDAAALAAAGVVDDLAAQIAQSEAARDAALNAAAAVKQMPGIFYWRDETIEPGLRYAEVAQIYELPATKLVAQVLNGGGSCAVSVWVDGERVVEPVTVGSSLVEQAISVTIPAGSNVQFGIEAVTGSVTGFYARVEGFPEGLSPYPEVFPNYTAFGIALGEAADAEAARELMQIEAGGGSSIAAWGRQSSDYTLTSTTSSQRIFNCSASGAVTLAVGHYLFDMMLEVANMSSTTGNCKINIAGAGSASVSGDLYHVIGVDSTTPGVAAAHSGLFVRGALEQSGVNIVNAGANGTGLGVRLCGRIRVTSAGTLIPSIELAVAAAATIKAGSNITFIALPGAVADTTFGAWS